MKLLNATNKLTRNPARFSTLHESTASLPFTTVMFGIGSPNFGNSHVAAKTQE